MSLYLVRVEPDRFFFYKGNNFEGEATLGWVERWYGETLRERYGKGPQQLEIGREYEI
ncbi:MAG: hypothetical protein QXY45_02060 [Candidatus Aenigmatarchaeota archaeon]